MIPEINIESQKQVISHIEIINKTIEKYTSSNIQIKEKDIFSTIMKINGF